MTKLRKLEIGNMNGRQPRRSVGRVRLIKFGARGFDSRREVKTSRVPITHDMYWRS